MYVVQDMCESWKYDGSASKGKKRQWFLRTCRIFENAVRFPLNFPLGMVLFVACLCICPCQSHVSSLARVELSLTDESLFLTRSHSHPRHIKDAIILSTVDIIQYDYSTFRIKTANYQCRWFRSSWYCI